MHRKSLDVVAVPYRKRQALGLTARRKQGSATASALTAFPLIHRGCGGRGWVRFEVSAFFISYGRMVAMPNPVQKPEAVPDDCSLIVGDCVERLSRFEESTIDAVVTDPPYGLEFMGKEWDDLSKTGARVGSSDERWTGADGRSIPSGRVQYGKFNAKVASVGSPTDSFSVQRKGQLPFGGAGQRVQYGNMNTGGQVMQEWHEQWARAVYRVLKPGAYMLCFGGTRTYHRLACAVEDAGFEIRDCIGWLYGSGFPKSLDVSKAIDKHLGAQREKVRHLNPRNPKSLASGKEIEGGDRPYLVEGRAKGYHDMDGPDPVTAAAAAWDGWGTALKPAWESVIVARKPMERTQEQRIIVENLTKLEAQLWSLLPANAALENFGLSQQEHDAACASARWSAEEKSNILAALSGLTGTSPFVSAIHSCLNTVSSWRNILGASCAQTSTFITEMKSSTTIAWSTLRSCSSALTPLTIIQAAMRQPGSWWNVVTAARVLNAAARNISATQELSALADAIDSERISRQDVGEQVIRPAWEPVLVCRKPPEGSIAENVLRHGVGGLNIDGCRVGTEKVKTQAKTSADSFMVKQGNKGFYGCAESEERIGRWPANVVHDGSDEVLEAFAAFGESKSRASDYNWKESNNDNPAHVTRNIKSGVHFEDAGTAARFFYCAKANAERDEFNKHPTLKPVALMEWLVKLVCPKDGLVLDPFTGSGTTAIACANTGRKFVGCEKDESYAAIAKTRMAVRKASESIAAPVNGQPGTSLGEEI